MAKHCDVCKRDYADDLSACPHCAAAKKTQLASGSAEDRKTQLTNVGPAELPAETTPSDAVIDLGQTPAVSGAGDAAEVPPSGASDVEWAALVSEPSANQLKVDSPSDADLLAHGTGAVEPDISEEEIVGELIAEEPPAPPAEDAEVVDLTEAAPEPAGPVSDSAVDLGASPVELVEEDSGAVVAAAPPAESDVFVAELASDASHVDLIEESAVNLADEDVIDLASPSDAALAPPLAETPPERDAVAEVVEATADPHAPEAELTAEAALDAVPLERSTAEVADEADEVVEAADDSGIDWGGVAEPSPSGVSGGVGLGRRSRLPRGNRPAGPVRRRGDRGGRRRGFGRRSERHR